MLLYVIAWLLLQECHQQILILSREAAAQVKQHGKSNDMVERILNTPYFAPIHDNLKELLDPATFVGRAPEQVKANHCMAYHCS